MPILLAQIPTPPFSERLILAIAGPLTSAILGTLIIGLIVWWVTDRVQQRRAAYERAREQQRADNEVKHELISAMTSAASELYLATQTYWRAIDSLRDENTPKGKMISPDEVQEIRRNLIHQYQKSRTEGTVIENRLGVFFESRQPREEWHKVMDLLTVRYFQLMDRDTPELYRLNAKGTDGKEHSGLSAQQLQDRKALLGAYHAALDKAIDGVFAKPLRDRTTAQE